MLKLYALRFVNKILSNSLWFTTKIHAPFEPRTAMLLSAPSPDIKPVSIGVRKSRQIQHADHVRGGRMVIRQGRRVQVRQVLRVALKVLNRSGPSNLKDVA